VRQVYHRRGTRRGLGDFAPLFDWGESAAVPASTDPVGLLRDACLTHLEAEGIICRQHFGLSLVKCAREDRGAHQPPGPLRATYKAARYCDALGALLDGKPFGAGVLPDAAKILGVDEFWLAGFMHGYDRTPGYWRGRNADAFDESDSYKAGFAAGRNVGDEFASVEVGWEAQ
jgi:hypothetical protein